MIAAAEHIITRYAARACFVCGVFGPCKHREWNVEAAYIAAGKDSMSDRINLKDRNVIWLDDENGRRYACAIHRTRPAFGCPHCKQAIAATAETIGADVNGNYKGKL